MFLSDYVAQVQSILHDTSSSAWTLQEVISRINDARRDVARGTAKVRRNVTGIQILQGVEIYNLNGAVVGGTVTASGSNYGGGTTVPVTYSAPPAGGVQALAVGNLVNGSLNSITMTQWGQGYQTIPTITVGGSGSGAAAVAVPLFQNNPLSTVVGNPLSIVNISNNWNNERYTLGRLNFTFFQAYARNWVNNTNQGPPGLWTHVQEDQKVYLRRAPDQVYQTEWDTVFLTSPLVATTDFDDELIEPWCDLVQFKAASYLLMKFRNMQEVKAFDDLYASKLPEWLTTSGGIIIPNPYHRTIQRRITGMGG